MNGAESLVATLAGEGVEICFANPGTSEMHFLAALENPSLRSVLVLFEGIATGAADGWYRMTNNPASTLLHLGPGLANGLANLHNARRAGSGIVNIVGEHATAHLKYDPPLMSDIEGLARPISHWVRRTGSSCQLASDTVAAVKQARSKPGKIATLILPGETSWGPAGRALQDATFAELHLRERADAARHGPGRASGWHTPSRRANPDRVRRHGDPRTRGRTARPHRRAYRLPHRDPVFHSADRTRSRPGALERIPYYVPTALAFLKGFKHIITVETGEPIAFFNYPGSPSLLKPPGLRRPFPCAARRRFRRRLSRC